MPANSMLSDVVKAIFENLSIKEGGAFVVDKAHASRRITEFLLICQDFGIHPVAAVKAFGCPDMIKLVSQHDITLDVSSENEIIASHTLGRPQQRFFLNGPGLDPGSIEKFGEFVVPIFQSGKQVADFIEMSGRRREVGLRISTSQFFENGTLERGSRFGLSLEDARRAAFILENEGHTVSVLHCHLTAKKIEIHTYLEMYDRLLSFGGEIASGRVIDYNLGGGQLPLATSSFDGIIELFSALRLRRKASTGRIFIEPGSMWLFGSIYYVANIISSDVCSSGTTVLIDGSPACSLQWSEKWLHATALGCEITANFIRLAGSTCCEYDFIESVPYSETNYGAHRNGKYPILILGNLLSYSIARAHGFNGLPRADLILVNPESEDKCEK